MKISLHLNFHVKIISWIPIPDEEKKIKLNIYFYTSLWCLKRFYEGLASKGFIKAFIKPFEAPQRSVKIKFNSIFISIQLSEMNGSLRVKQEKQLKFTQLRKMSVFKNCSSGILDRQDFLYIFLRFLDFWGLFSYKTFSHKKTV